MYKVTESDNDSNTADGRVTGRTDGHTSDIIITQDKLGRTNVRLFTLRSPFCGSRVTAIKHFVQQDGISHLSAVLPFYQ